MPEFFSTGINHQSFINEPEDTNGGAAIDKMCQLVIELNTNIVCGSVIEKDGENLYNTTFVTNRLGEVVAKYRKRHLFNCFGGSEHKRITAGIEVVIAPLDIGNIGLSICFDIRYPLHFLKLKEMGAEVIVCPTAWGYMPSSKDEMDWLSVWRSFNIARANENNITIISANQTGDSPNGFYSIGHSMVCDNCGRVIFEANDEEILKTVSLSIIK